MRCASVRPNAISLAATAGWQAVKMQHTEGDGYVVQLRMLDLTHPAATTP